MKKVLAIIGVVGMLYQPAFAQDVDLWGQDQHQNQNQEQGQMQNQNPAWGFNQRKAPCGAPTGGAAGMTPKLNPPVQYRPLEPTIIVPLLPAGVPLGGAAGMCPQVLTQPVVVPTAPVAPPEPVQITPTQPKTGGGAPVRGYW